MRIFLIAAGGFLLGSLLSFADEKSNPHGGATLDGTSWKITAVPDEISAKGGAVRFDDKISFVGGKFRSVSLASKDFKPAKYRGDFEEREAEFDLEQQSDTQGIVIWIGEIRGDRIVGRLQWKKKDGTNLIFNFAGTKD